MATLKLTEKALATDCRATDAERAYYWDTELRGFGVVVFSATGRKRFVARGRVNGKLSGKLTIGEAGQPNPDGLPWTVTLARLAARKLLGQMASGRMPVAPRKATRSEGPTLRDALKYHLGRMERGENRRGKVCSPRSIRTLRSGVELHLADWLDRPLVDLTADALDDARAAIESEAERIEGSNPDNPPGRAVANRLLANVSAIWRSYDKRYGLPIPCPVRRLTPGALKPRDNRIGNAELPAWHARVMAMENHVRRDLQLVALYTGVRTDGVRNIRWDDVDFDDELVTIQRAKGDRPYAIPMVASVREVLERRQRDNPEAMNPWGGDHGFVFPSLARNGKTVQAVAEAKERAVKRDRKGKALKDEDGNVIRETYLPGVQACRKTFNSVAIEIGVPREIRERLMNHEGRGVNVKSYGFPEDWTATRQWADRIEAALKERLDGKVTRKPRHLRSVS
jgi:integrase